MPDSWKQWWREIAPYIAADLVLLGVVVWVSRPKPPVASFIAGFDQGRGEVEVSDNP